MAKEKIELTYQRAFEMGYWLERGKYEKLDQLIKSAEIHPDFQKGLQDGRKEAEHEVIHQAFRAIREYETAEKQDVNPDFQKGFEQGYWLKRGDSKDLDKVIEGSKNQAPYHQGLKGGKKEAEREKIRERLQGNNEKSNSLDKGIDID